jgi:hypothetical protein
MNENEIIGVLREILGELKSINIKHDKLLISIKSLLDKADKF